MCKETLAEVGWLQFPLRRGDRLEEFFFYGVVFKNKKINIKERLFILIVCSVDKET